MRKVELGEDCIGVGGGILIFNESGEVLLIKRGVKSRNGAGQWEKPGGAVDYGETIEQAMKREVKEEVNLNVDIWGVLPHTDHIVEGQHWVAFNYLADSVNENEIKNMEPYKFDEVRWFSLNNLPKNIGQPTTEAIENYLKNKYINLK